MDLFVRESGPMRAPAIVFLHGGRTSGWSWEPVVEQLPGYRCLAPDLPGFGASARHGPFGIGRAADAVAELIRSRVDSRRASVVGFSLGAQVAVHLLATEPDLIDRAVLCGTFVNPLPYPRLTLHAAGLLARNPISRWTLRRRWSARRMGVPAASLEMYRADMRLAAGDQLDRIVSESAGFGVPTGLAASRAPALFVTGSREPMPVRRSGAVLARRMPGGTEAVALGLRHDWPMRRPGLCARTVAGWVSGASLPEEIVVR
jgi:pimeloyl-ACP methyl ester carboxylesterase